MNGNRYSHINKEVSLDGAIYRIVSYSADRDIYFLNLSYGLGAKEISYEALIQILNSQYPQSVMSNFTNASDLGKTFGALYHISPSSIVGHVEEWTIVLDSDGLTAVRESTGEFNRKTSIKSAEYKLILSGHAVYWDRIQKILFVGKLAPVETDLQKARREKAEKIEALREEKRNLSAETVAMFRAAEEKVRKACQPKYDAISRKIRKIEESE